MIPIKKFNLYFLCILFLFILLFIFVDVPTNSNSATATVYKNVACKPENVLKIFSNNLMAVIFYVIPVLGFGKLLLDLYITVGSLKAYILHNNFENTLFLFFPHFLFELYAMTIWVCMSWILFRDFFIKKEIHHKNYIKLILLSIVLLIISASIEATERCFF
ncbi:hypothetical protein G6554_25400 [Bacillus sp. MM2020_4]|nr:hypothetical protein [Bacillus sp. MM2020_4]